MAICSAQCCRFIKVWQFGTKDPFQNSTNECHQITCLSMPWPFNALARTIPCTYWTCNVASRVTPPLSCCLNRLAGYMKSCKGIQADYLPEIKLKNSGRRRVALIRCHSSQKICCSVLFQNATCYILNRTRQLWTQLCKSLLMKMAEGCTTHHNFQFGSTTLEQRIHQGTTLKDKWNGFCYPLPISTSDGALNFWQTSDWEANPGIRKAGWIWQIFHKSGDSYNWWYDRDIWFQFEQ